jgi:hypothetical protein
MEQKIEEEIITEKEKTALLIQLGRGQETFTAEDAKIVIDWAIKIRIDNAILDALMHDTAFALTVVDGEIHVKLVE